MLRLIYFCKRGGSRGQKGLQVTRPICSLNSFIHTSYRGTWFMGGQYESLARCIGQGKRCWANWLGLNNYSQSHTAGALYMYRWMSVLFKCSLMCFPVLCCVLILFFNISKWRNNILIFFSTTFLNFCIIYLQENYQKNVFKFSFILLFSLTFVITFVSIINNSFHDFQLLFQ